MNLFFRHQNQGKVYIDENRKIQWIWASFDKSRIKAILQDTRLLKKTICYALAAGTLTGIILSFI